MYLGKSEKLCLNKKEIIWSELKMTKKISLVLKMLEMPSFCDI